MSYEYDPRELGRKGRDQLFQQSSGDISELQQAMRTEDCQQILFDFSPGQSSDKHKNQDEELDIWKMIPGIAPKYNFCLKKITNSLLTFIAKKDCSIQYLLYSFRRNILVWALPPSPDHLALDKKLTNEGPAPPNVVISTEFCMIEAGETVITRSRSRYFILKLKL